MLGGADCDGAWACVATDRANKTLKRITARLIQGIPSGQGNYLIILRPLRRIAYGMLRFCGLADDDCIS